MTKIWHFYLAMFGLVFFLHLEIVNADTPIQDIEGVPAWVVNKGQVITDQKDYVFGVGSTPEIKNSALRRQVAETMARKDLTATLTAEIDANTSIVMNDDDVDVSSIINEAVKATLRRAEIIQYWEHPEQNTAYALARISIDDFLSDIQKMMPTEKK